MIIIKKDEEIVLENEISRFILKVVWNTIDYCFYIKAQVTNFAIYTDKPSRPSKKLYETLFEYKFPYSSLSVEEKKNKTIILNRYEIEFYDACEKYLEKVRLDIIHSLLMIEEEKNKMENIEAENFFDTV